MRAVLQSVARGLPVSTINRRSIFTSVLVLVGVLALFFIPEIISFRDSSGSTTASREMPEESAPYSDTSEHFVAASPLEKVLIGLDSGATPSAGMGRMADLPEQSTEAEEDSIKQRSDEIWKVALSKAGKRALVDARNNSTKLAKEIKDHYPQSKFALMNFVSGVNYFASSAARKSMTGMEAVNYLEQLQFAVTQAMRGERVDRKTYMSWIGISLFPIFSESRTTRMAQAFSMPFRPNTTLTDVEISVKKNGASHVRVRGLVQGSDIKELAVYRNGVWLKRITVKPARNDPQQTALFNFSHRDATGKYTIRAYDKFGKVFDKYYVFLGGARGLTQPALSGPDPRFDKYYRVGSKSS